MGRGVWQAAIVGSQRIGDDLATKQSFPKEEN